MSQKSETVSLLCDSLTFVRQCGQGFTYKVAEDGAANLVDVRLLLSGASRLVRGRRRTVADAVGGPTAVPSVQGGRQSLTGLHRVSQPPPQRVLRVVAA